MASSGTADGRARPFVTVVIPHLNQIEAADRCLRSIEAQSYPRDRFEIILVDNGSTSSLDDIQARHPQVRILHEPKPGPGLARNRGVAAATGEILAFIDADCRADPHWLAAAVDGLAQSGDGGVVGGDVRIDFVDPARLTGLEAYEAVFVYRQKLYIERHRYSGTGNLAMRAPLFEKIGPFGGIEIAEDRDWGGRAFAAGHVVRYRPDMIVFHPARRSFAEIRAKFRRHIAHQLAAHRARGASPAIWIARAFAVLLSAVPHTAKLLVSDRLSGISNRLAGVAMLYRIRFFRFCEMLRQLGQGSADAADGWNRAGVGDGATS